MNSHLRRKKRRAAERSWKRIQAMLKAVYGDAPLLSRRAGKSHLAVPAWLTFVDSLCPSVPRVYATVNLLLVASGRWPEKKGL